MADTKDKVNTVQPTPSDRENKDTQDTQDTQKTTEVKKSVKTDGETKVEVNEFSELAQNNAIPKVKKGI